MDKNETTSRIAKLSAKFRTAAEAQKAFATERGFMTGAVVLGAVIAPFSPDNALFALSAPVAYYGIGMALGGVSRMLAFATPKP